MKLNQVTNSPLVGCITFLILGILLSSCALPRALSWAPLSEENLLGLEPCDAADHFNDFNLPAQEFVNLHSRNVAGELTAHEDRSPARVMAKAMGNAIPAPAESTAPAQKKITGEEQSEGEVEGRFRTVRTRATYLSLEEEPDSMTTGEMAIEYSDTLPAAANWARLPVGSRFRISGSEHGNYLVESFLAGEDPRLVELGVTDPAVARQWGEKDLVIEILQLGSFEKSHELLKSQQTRRPNPALAEMMIAVETVLAEKKSDVTTIPQIRLSDLHQNRSAE